MLPGQPCAPSEVSRTKVRPFTNTRPMLHEMAVDVKGNAVVWALNVGRKSYELRAAQELLVKLVKEPFYTELRTRQQTGYLVSSSGFQAAHQLFLQAAIQSNTHDPRDLLSRIELFTETFLRSLADDAATLQPRFDSIKAALLARLRSPYDTAAGKLRFMQHLAFDENEMDGDDDDDQPHFDAIERRRRALEAYDLPTLRARAVEMLGDGNNGHPRRVAVLATGNGEENVKRAYVRVGLEEMKRREG
ncbi:uncharacterized protein EV422DRAFT_157520 [Fimicolochytrium jonesii]|uniref:uncharacterized protein n=1 Tax=Fimicolochytrium jonesii TaxID=1396493 RepID=UPI0022FEB50A|nr:uncharacterized protein EV422DRAFT_157520 [Fimicolochytrium jonesii]KAI8826194.1 hypothetical protein EV422DRAFT_157520 [Fimicolochytrium jonesii]